VSPSEVVQSKFIGLQVTLYIKENAMGGACSKHGKARAKTSWESLCDYGMIIFKWFLGKGDATVCAGFIRLKLGA
jgi:hypothetical protein